MNPVIRLLKTIHQVGVKPVLQVALYRLGLVVGHYRRLTPTQESTLPEKNIGWVKSGISFQDSEVTRFLRNHTEFESACLQEARMVISGKCRIFGELTVDIFQPEMDFSYHWTEYERGNVLFPVEDIKYIWEPARLGWVFTMCRAAAYKTDPKLGLQTWKLIERFLRQNPPNQGPNWMNGQEVALRIFALVLFHEVFKDDPDLPAEWQSTLAQAVVAHAKRIPPTLVYAKSQQNNHLLVEAAGLYTAGVMLPEYPDSAQWKETGWYEFHKALDTQIQPDGTYAQFSTNYHRLMLQISIWMRAISLREGMEFPESSLKKLAAATNWLKNLMSPHTGQVPNYGHNDGAYIFPLTDKPFYNFRPAVQTSEQFFCGGLTPEDPEEMTLWFDWLAGKKVVVQKENQPDFPARSYGKLDYRTTAAVMFAPSYSSRPGQADLLHTEIWQVGNPITLDPGTYRYNAPSPWNNSLSLTKFHNTVTINNENQMQKAGRFLWLDWPETKWQIEGEDANSITASHNGYRKFGVIHKRKVVFTNENVWQVFDTLNPHESQRTTQVDIWLHWLLQDWDWDLIEDGIQSGSDFPKCKILVKSHNSSNLQHLPVEIQILRAGVLKSTSANLPRLPEDLSNFGWYSPTYGTKEPAVSYRVRFQATPPITFLTEFQLS